MAVANFITYVCFLEHDLISTDHRQPICIWLQQSHPGGFGRGRQKRCQWGPGWLMMGAYVRLSAVFAFQLLPIGFGPREGRVIQLACAELQRSLEEPPITAYGII